MTDPADIQKIMDRLATLELENKNLQDANRKTEAELLAVKSSGVPVPGTSSAPHANAGQHTKITQTSRPDSMRQPRAP